MGTPVRGCQRLLAGVIPGGAAQGEQAVWGPFILPIEVDIRLTAVPLCRARDNGLAERAIRTRIRPTGSRNASSHTGLTVSHASSLAVLIIRHFTKAPEEALVATQEVTLAAVPEATQEVTLEAVPEATQEVTLEAVPEATLEATLAAVPEATQEVTLAGTTESSHRRLDPSPLPPGEGRSGLRRRCRFCTSANRLGRLFRVVCLHRSQSGVP